MVLIFMDILIVIVFVSFLWKNRSLNIEEDLQKKMDVFESLLMDADQMTIHMKKNLEEKYRVLKNLEESLDQRIHRLEHLMDIADKKIISFDTAVHEKPVSSELTQVQQILLMVKQGLDLEDIAGRLSIPRGTVKLVLELNKKS
ncbi:DUF6115 domain-containing protein [Desulfocicer niacini]